MMVTVFTKPQQVDAVLVDDVLRTPAEDWSGLPDWLRRMHVRGNLNIRPGGVDMIDIGHIKTLLTPEDWIVHDAYGVIYAVSADDFADRFYPREERPEPPFKAGDVVSLTSGGFAMTVEDCRHTCAPGEHLVDVLWGGNAGQAEFSRETLPSACLTSTRARNDDNIPF